jgi:hypothetical protein
VKVTNDVGSVFTYEKFLQTGNYNIYDFQQMVNAICSQFFNLTYKPNKNKWYYDVGSTSYNTVSIVCSKYNYKYFGVAADTIVDVLYLNIPLYSNLINMNNFSLIVVKILGLVEISKCLDNFNENGVNDGDVCAIINRQDNNVGSLINWTDNNQSFLKKIENAEINQLTFKFYNEFNEELIDLSDWVITMKIIISKK